MFLTIISRKIAMRRLGYFVMSIIFAEKENCFGLKNNFKINIRKLQKHKKGSKCHVLANFNKCTSDISLFYFLTNLKGDMYIVNYVWCPVELFTPYLVVGWLQRMIFFYLIILGSMYLPTCPIVFILQTHICHHSMRSTYRVSVSIIQNLNHI